ncbi:MAG: penicillin-binding transpeptidase domain-containing protein, partial [Candidatus Xenobia bacterium]
SIGQGYLQVTPLQMAVVTATVANSGALYPPYLVASLTRPATGDVVWKHVPKPRRRVPVKPQYFAALRIGMAGTVDHGTATTVKNNVISVGGKTGTAENSPTVTNPHGRNHTWFVSFAPVSHPQVVCVVFVEKAGGYGGGVAAPVARDLLEAWAHDR